MKTPPYEEEYRINPAPYDPTENVVSFHSAFHSRWRSGFVGRSSGARFALYALVLQGEMTTVYPGRRFQAHQGCFVINRMRIPYLRSTSRGGVDLVRKVFNVRFNAFHDLILAQVFPRQYTVVPLDDVREIEPLMDRIYEELGRRPWPDQTELSGCFFKLLHRLQDEQNKPRLPAPLRQTLAYLNENLARPGLTREAVSDAAGVGLRTLDRLFRKHLRTSVTQYIIDCRLRQVCAMLNLRGLSIKEIATKCGFPDASYLTRIFRKRQGMPPRQYRRNSCEELA